MKNLKYKNETSINRTRQSKDHHKKSISMDIIKDDRLNIIELGLIIKLLTKSKNYIINKNREQRTAGIPENKFLSSWKKTSEFGIYKKRKVTRWSKVDN